MTEKLSYTYYPEDEVWKIHETKTNHIVGEYFFEDDAIEQMNFLEKGGGFDGFTPDFMIKKINSKIELDEAFTIEFPE